MLGSLLFFLFATVAIAAAIGMIVARSPINSALWLILNFFCLACLYLTLNAQFIAVIQILVYAGAIMVLFLFVIMLLNLDALPRVKDFDWRKGLAFGVGVAVLAQLMFVIALGLDALPEPMNEAEAAVLGSASSIGLELFTRYAVMVQVIAVLLLAATIGAVMLAKKKFV